MAKRRKETTEDEEIDFKIPKFDEESFLRRERRNIKTTFIAFLFGILLAVISFGFWVLLSGEAYRWLLILLVGIFNAAWIKYIFLRLNIDLTNFGKKGWFATYGIYFLTWLLVLIIIVNPPFYDGEAPLVEIAALPGMQELGGTVLIVAKITDNVGVKEQNIDFSLTCPNGTNYSPEFTFENNIFRYIYENPTNLTGEYSYKLVATDVNGRKTEKDGSFEYNNDTLEIISSRFSDIRSGDAITIKADETVSAENFRVYYRIDGGTDINVNRKTENDKEKYETTAEYKGWTPNSNATVRVYAEVVHYFINVPVKFANTVEDTKVYTFSTGDDQNMGKEDTLVEYNHTLATMRKSQLTNTLNYQLPHPISVGNIPGFETVIFIVSLIVVVLIFKRKKKDKKT